jgi:hypothetical protein
VEPMMIRKTGLATQYLRSNDEPLASCPGFAGQRGRGRVK